MPGIVGIDDARVELIEKFVALLLTHFECPSATDSRQKTFGVALFEPNRTIYLTNKKARETRSSVEDGA